MSIWVVSSLGLLWRTLLWLFWCVSFGEYIHTYSSLAGVELLGCRVCVSVDTVNRFQSVCTSLHCHQKCKIISRLHHPWNASPLCPVRDLWNVAMRGISLVGGGKPMLFLQVSYTEPLTQEMRDLPRIKINAGKHCAPKGKERRLGTAERPARLPSGPAPHCGPEVWPSGLCLASAATLWKPQSWQLSPRICSITEQRPCLLRCLGQKREQCWCPHAPRRRRAPNCTDPQFPLLLQLGPQTHHQCSLLNPQTGLLL